MLFSRYNKLKLLSLVNTSSANHGSSSSGNHVKSFLSHEQAIARFKNFEKNSINYQVALKLKEGEAYEGDINIKFDLKDISKDIFLDYAGKHIKEITINN